MIFDVPSNYVTDTTGDMIMTMNMQMGETTMKMNLKARTLVKAQVF